jgi:hypothetical protein
MFYNARWYDPALGRFAQADTIIPGGVQGLDRYAYANNNPLMYTDPSGHVPCDEQGYCYNRGKKYQAPFKKDNLNFNGYSGWERKVLRKLYEDGGPNAEHGVLYILQNDIHIKVGTGWQTAGGNTGAWFDEGSNTLTLNSDSSAGSVDSNGQITTWGLSLVIHEARHLEQGTELSHSKLGEMEGWQVQIDVLKHLGHFPDPNRLPDWALDIGNAATVDAFSSAVQFHWPGYWNRLHGSDYGANFCIGLCAYRDYPDWRWMNGNWSYGTPWWLRLNFTP